MSDLYALLNEEGKIVSYPITKYHAYASGMPAHLLAPVKKPIRPTPSMGEAVYETQVVSEGVVYVAYEVRKRPVDEMMKEVSRLLGELFNRVATPPETVMFLHYLRSMLIEAVQAKLDSLAKAHTYCDFNELVSFSKSKVSHYRADALAAIELRDKVWVEFDNYMSSAEAKQVAYPRSLKELMDKLPMLTLDSAA
jgi:hypothetical protein